MTNARSLANFATGIGTEGAVLTVDNTNNRIGIATTNPQNDLQVGLGITMEGDTGQVTFVGVVTAASFVGDGTGLTGVASTDNIVTGTAATFTSTVSIANSIFHVGDTNTAFGFPANDTFTVRTSGSERLLVSSDGNIRHSGSGGETIFEMQRTDSNTTGAVGTINFLASDDHSVASMSAMGDGDNEGAHIVFRTTSAAANESPYNAATAERLRIESNGYVKTNSEFWIGGGASPVLRWRDGGSEYATARISSGDLYFEVANAERLRIDSSGIIKTPNLNGNNHREIHRHITGFSSGSSVVNYLLICETSRTNVLSPIHI